MKQYKIIIKQTPDFWEFEGPRGPFKMPRKTLDIKYIHLQRLLELNGFIVEWREKPS